MSERKVEVRVWVPWMRVWVMVRVEVEVSVVVAEESGPA